NKIKQQCRRKANDLIEVMKAELAQRSEAERNPLLLEKEQLNKLRESSMEHTELQTTLNTQIQVIEDALNESNCTDANVHLLHNTLSERYKFIKEEVYEFEEIEEELPKTQVQESRSENSQQNSIKINA